MPEQRQTSPAGEENKKKPSPQLVRDVTDKVYAMWQRDLALEKERKRISGR